MWWPSIRPPSTVRVTPLLNGSSNYSPLVFEGVSHGYGDGPPVLDGFDWTVPRGVVGVLGNNGVGKSTLLKLATGFVRPRTGRVTLSGVATDQMEVRARTAFLPESLTVDGHLTAREFITFAANIRRVDSAASTAMTLLEHFGVGDRADELMRGLSFGSRRKVGLAAAFL